MLVLIRCFNYISVLLLLLLLIAYCVTSTKCETLTVM